MPIRTLIPSNKDLLLHAFNDIDTRETPGERHTPAVLRWLRGAGITWGGDEMAWCSAWAYDLVGRVPGTPRPEKRRARALSWLEVGEHIELKDALPGDFVIFDRGKGRGHVGLFLRQVGNLIVVYGGNQGNRIWPKHYKVSKLKGIRRLCREYDLSDLQPRESAVLRAQREGFDLFRRKHRDYGDSVAEHGLVGVLVRIQDKLNRLKTITNNGLVLVSDETVRDTLIDLQMYSAIAVTFYEEGVIGQP